MDANSISKLRPEIENLARNRGQKLDFETKSEIECLASISGKNLDFGFRPEIDSISARNPKSRFRVHSVFDTLNQKVYQDPGPLLDHVFFIPGFVAEVPSDTICTSEI